MRTLSTFRLILLITLSVTGASAQTSSGAIAGRLFDPAVGAVANAQVTLTNQQTKEVRKAATQSSGDFVFSSVQPGVYRIDLRAAGFKQLEKEDLVLTASEHLSAGNLQLQIGAVNESVSVEAQPTPAVIRKLIGYGHIPSQHAEAVRICDCRCRRARQASTALPVQRLCHSLRCQRREQ